MPDRRRRSLGSRFAIAVVVLAIVFGIAVPLVSPSIFKADDTGGEVDTVGGDDLDGPDPGVGIGTITLVVVLAVGAGAIAIPIWRARRRSDVTPRD